MCEKKEDSKFNEMTLKSKFRLVLNNLTVEPVVACFIIPSVLAQLANQNLNLEKACRVNLKYSDEVCDALTSRQTQNYTHEETEVQQLVAGMAVWKTFIQSSIPGFLILFLGSWSDRKRRRKPLMIMPIIGDILSTSGLIVCVYYFYELSMETSGFVECIFPALTGGWMTMIMAVFSYIGDITTLENRTLRIGFVNIFISAGFPIGISLSGVLFKAIGFYGIFFTSLSLYIFAFVWAVLKVKEPKKLQNESNKTDFDSESNKQSGGTVLRAIKDLFDLKHLKETIIIVFKNNNRNRRKRVALLLVVLVVVIGPMHGMLNF